MARIERKYLAHFIDSSCNINPDEASTQVTYIRLGQDLEAFAEELSPQVDIRKNILGEQTVIHNGYEVSSSVDPFYATDSGADKPLYDQLVKIANGRLNGDDCRTTRVEALLSTEDPTTSVWAYREDCWIVPQNFGGDTSGIQIPFQVLNCGNRVAGTMSYAGKKWTFTPTEG